jgi:hypothetical protein
MKEKRRWKKVGGVFWCVVGEGREGTKSGEEKSSGLLGGEVGLGRSKKVEIS